jgi:hypothetical protein
MKISFPSSNKRYIQNNRTNVYPLSNIWSSFNIDLQSVLGVLRISPRTKLVTSTASIAALSTTPVGFVYDNSTVFTVAGTSVFEAPITDGIIPPGTWKQNTGSSLPTNFSDASDIKLFTGRVFATTANGLWSTGGPSAAWTDRSMSLGGGSHQMVYFKKFDRLYVKDTYSTINSINNAFTVALASNSADYTLTLWANQEGTISCFTADSDQIWIGTVNDAAGAAALPAKVFTWDGISAQPSKEYLLESQGLVAMVVKDGIPYGMDTNGALVKFTGYAFEEVARLPVDQKFLDRAKVAGAFRYMHPNGMIVTRNNTIQVLVNNVNNDNGATVNENFPSGVFEWSEENGFVHKYSLSYNPVGSSTITDYGQNRISRAGALANINIGDLNTESSIANRNGTILMGALVYTNASSTTAGIWIDDSLNTIQKKGYIVTDWLESDEIASSWDVFWMSYRRFLDSGDNITVKYRNVEVAPVEASITWVNTTSFTVLNSAVDISQYWTEGTGGEVEILQGTGSGVCAHITNAVNNAGTWTVTIDEAATGVTTGTAKARFQKWIRIFPSPNSPLATPNNWSQFSIGSDSQPRIQMKICFTYTGNGEFYKSVITSNEDIAITK